MIISHFVTQQDADLSGTLLPITSLSELSILSGPSWRGGPSAPKWNKTSTLLLDGDLWDLASAWDSEGCLIDGWLKQDSCYKQFIVFMHKCEQFSLVLSINVMHRESMNVAWYEVHCCRDIWTCYLIHCLLQNVLRCKGTCYESSHIISFLCICYVLSLFQG